MKETDAIFSHLKETHQQAACAEDTLRLSLDAKAPVLIGPFSRRGKGRKGNKGADHDFKPWGKLTPFGIFLPDSKDLSFSFTHSKVTSGFIVDRLDEWWQVNRERYPKVRKLLLDLDNGRVLTADFEVDLQAALGTPPTPAITEVGMAALLPRAHLSARVVAAGGGKLAVEIEACDLGRHEQADLAVKAFELSQSLTEKWLTADFDAKRRILEILWLNCTLVDVSLIPEWRKPFDLLAQGLPIGNSRGEKI